MEPLGPHCPRWPTEDIVGQHKGPYTFGCSRRRRAVGGICRAGGIEIFRGMLPNLFMC